MKNQTFVDDIDDTSVEENFRIYIDCYSSIFKAYNYQQQEFLRPHDHLTYIDPRQQGFNSMNVPIPVPMLMPAGPGYYNNNGQMMPNNSKFCCALTLLNSLFKF